MARNGSGTYTKVNTFAPGDTITASGHNQNWDDIADEMTNSVAADGQTTMTGPLKHSSGSAASPSMTFSTDTDTGLYRSAANELSAAAGGAQVWSTDSTGLDIKTGKTLKLAGTAAFPVPTAQIADGAVTLAKMADLASGNFIVRHTASTGVPQTGTFGAGFSLNTSTGEVTTTLNPTLVPNYLSGLTMSTGGGSGNMVIAAGVANDSTNTSLMSFSGYTKTTSSWVAGNGGGLDTGAIGNNGWYHFYLIQRPDTGAVDAIFSLNASAPSLPTNYTLYRRIGSAKTDSSAHWIAFVQYGDEFLWTSPSADVSTTTLTAVPTNFVLAGVPTGVKVRAQITGTFSNASAGTALLIQSPDATGTGPNLTTGLVTSRVQVNSIAIAFVDTIRTDTSAQITAYASAASSTLLVSTRGWTDLRGKT